MTGGSGPTRSAKLSVTLTGESLAAAQAIAQQHGISEGQAVRRAISVLKFLSDEAAAGSVLRIQSKNGQPEILRIIFT